MYEHDQAPCPYGGCSHVGHTDDGRDQPRALGDGVSVEHIRHQRGEDPDPDECKLPVHPPRAVSIVDVEAIGDSSRRADVSAGGLGLR